MEKIKRKIKGNYRVEEAFFWVFAQLDSIFSIFLFLNTENFQNFIKNSNF